MTDQTERLTAVYDPPTRPAADQETGWQAPALPPRDKRFTGRLNELETLKKLLAETEPVFLYGINGIGKTALALELAYQVRSQFSGGIFWLEGFGETGQTVEYVWRTFAQAHPVGRIISAEPRPLTLNEVQTWLAEAPGRVLVIVDGVTDRDALLELRMILPPTTAFLATSVQPIEVASCKNILIGRLALGDGLALLRSALNMPENLSIEMLAPIESIAALLDGHPLSLRLAVEWLRRMGGWRAGLLYIKRFNETENILKDLPLRHYDPAEKAFSMVYKALSLPQKNLFRALSVFAPGLINPAAIQAFSDSDPKVLDGDLSGLLIAEENGYRLNALIRTYAGALAHADQNTLHARHLAFYLTQAAQRLQEHQTAPDPEISQYRAAFVWARTDDPEQLMPYVMAAGQWLYAQQQYVELNGWLEVTLRLAPPDEESMEQASTLRALGDLSLRLENLAAARDYYDRALVLYYQTKSLSGQANTLKALGDLSARENQLDVAQEYYDRTLQLYAQIDFQLGRANTLKALGDLSIQGDDLKSAKDYYTRTLALYQQIDFQLGEAHTLKSLGDLGIQAHDWLAAEEYYHDALAIYHETKFQTFEASTLLAIGDLHMQLNAVSQALEAYQFALKLYTTLHDRAGQASTLKILGKLHQEQNNPEGAAEMYDQALRYARENHAAGEEAVLSGMLGQLRLRQGNRVEAVRLLLNALGIFTSLNIPRHMDETRAQLRDIARQAGDSFPAIWQQAVSDSPLPDWLKQPSNGAAIPQELIYAVRDFMIADNWTAARRIIEKHRTLMLTDQADEVFARMLRQYAGQPGPTKQIDKYRALLQRCRQIGVDAAFDEIQAPATTSEANRAARLYQSLDAYAEALDRLADIPLVYASIQINRASTLRELAALPEQDRAKCLNMALEAYENALDRQRNVAPLDYAQTQLAKAETLSELGEFIGQDRAQCLRDMLAAYDEALSHQRTMPNEFARTQISRGDTLHQIASLPGEKMLDRLQMALDAYDEALDRQHGYTVDYARTQSRRARVLYDMAGLPGQDFSHRMTEALEAYDDALEFLRDEDSLEYARTQSQRIALLRDMAGLPGEDRTARLYQALAASNEALRYLSNAPLEYARVQINRAHLLREIAGLHGEHRLARMREALSTYNEVIAHVRSVPLDYAMAQNSRAALLRELAGMSGENRSQRLRQTMEAAWEALLTLETLDNSAQLRTARRMMVNARQEFMSSEGGQAEFDRLWMSVVGKPQPDWLSS